MEEFKKGRNESPETEKEHKQKNSPETEKEHKQKNFLVRRKAAAAALSKMETD
jgi:hypothetical protein